MKTGDAPVPQIKVATYQAPQITVTPVTAVISTEHIEPGRTPGAYQHVLLDTTTGVLSFHEGTEHLERWDPSWTAINDVPRETWKRWHPGTLFTGGGGPHTWFEPVPELLCWVIDSGFTGHPYLDVEAANALLELVAPTAQELLDSFFEAGGELDWSAAAAHTARNICRLTSRYREAAPLDVDSELVDYAAIVQRFPAVYRPDLLRLTSDKLAEACEYQTRFLGNNEHWHPEIKKVFGAPHSDGSGVSLGVLGVRSWYRTARLEGDPRPPRDFSDWNAEHGSLAGSGITSDCPDTALDTWAERQDLLAAQQGLRLLGAKEAAHSHRANLREQDWDRLAVVGAEVARLETLRAERSLLVRRAIGWGRDDSAIASRARMSRQAVNKMRTNDGQS
ncbi:hypothetical protein [Streptomyces sp. NPDC056987]|uniref:hypothetical protein n=1 Tax=Streptomyces sp. NPDC056987 TaxID=3345988 RepID=UPI00363F274F